MNVGVRHRLRGSPGACVPPRRSPDVGTSTRMSAIRAVGTQLSGPGPVAPQPPAGGKPPRPEAVVAARVRRTPGNVVCFVPVCRAPTPRLTAPAGFTTPTLVHTFRTTKGFACRAGRENS
jgi:hypothetical protein